MAKRKGYEKYVEAKELLRTWMANGYEPSPNENDEIRQALNIVVGRPDARSKKAQIRDEILANLKKGRVADIELFKKYSYGRLEMNQVIQHFIRDEALNRTWIAYDENTSEYYIYATGDDVPKGWIGYIPKDM